MKNEETTSLIVHEGRRYPIGLPIDFSACYSTIASERFLGHGKYPAEAQPTSKSPKQHGYVIGVRTVIMTTTMYQPSDGYTPGSREGTRETVLLATRGMRSAPYLVRFRDIIQP